MDTVTVGDYFVRKRRYSAFFGTDLETLLKGLGVDTLVLIGGLTDVCVHYTFVDGHRHDYFVKSQIYFAQHGERPCYAQS